LRGGGGVFVIVVFCCACWYRSLEVFLGFKLGEGFGHSDANLNLARATK